MNPQAEGHFVPTRTVRVVPAPANAGTGTGTSTASGGERCKQTYSWANGLTALGLTCFTATFSPLSSAMHTLPLAPCPITAPCESCI